MRMRPMQWAMDLPAGTSRDGALDVIANRLDGRDSSVAVRWGEAIERPELRDARLEDHCREMVEH